MRTPDQTMKTRGQVMVLGCIALLVLALMLMLSFSVSTAIHERIRIQSVADAQAFSVATMEARGMNVAAYTNRAIAAMVVTNMSVHAWWAIASETVSILNAASKAMYLVAVEEVALCIAQRNPMHCKDAKKAREIGSDYSDEADTYEDKIKAKENDFNAVVEALNKAAIDLHTLQKDVLDRVKNEISHEGTVLSAVRQKGARFSSYASIHSTNLGEFACALEGSSFDGDCAPLIGSARSKASADDRSIIIENAANAARGKFQRNCGNGFCNWDIDSWFSSPNGKRLKEIRGNEGSTPYAFNGKAGTSDSKDATPGNTVKSWDVGAQTKGGLVANWRHGVGAWKLGSKVFSDENGGEHSPGHQGTHDKFKGVQKQDVCSSTSCFINFRATSDKDADFGQPSTFGAVTQDLRLLTDGKKGKWEINSTGKIEVKLGSGAVIKVQIVPRGTGTAVAKGKTYFHQLGDWQMAPNMFDPFWRAKLHPFKRAELKKVLNLAGDSDGAAVAASGPIEGDLQ